MTERRDMASSPVDIAAQEGCALTGASPKEGSPKHQIAVFDFDGTSIRGNSPVMLVRYLYNHGLLKSSEVLPIALWGLSYKMRLPNSEDWVRRKVFSAFEGWPKEQADDLMRRFYAEKVSHRFREGLDRAIKRHHDEGREVMVVSASFEPIILAAMEEHDYDVQFATRMKVDENGRYLREVDGAPVEGVEKLRLVRQYADDVYGPGNWELAYAYGDHHSDIPLLEAARVPLAVSPERALARAAQARGWTVLDWGHGE